MAYRSTGAHDIIDLNNELQAMAARGRSRLRREAASAEEKARRQQRREARREAARLARATRRAQKTRGDRLARSCSLVALLGTDQFFLYYFGFSLYLIPAALTWLVASVILGAPWHAFLWGLGVSATLPVLAMPWTRRAAARAIKNEQAWIDGLPFTLDGHLETLSQDLSRATVSASMDFQRSTPEWELVRDLLAAEGLLSSEDRTEPPTQEGGRLTLRAPQGGLENRGYGRWVHGLVELLSQLHPLYPVARVQIGAHR